MGRKTTALVVAVVWLVLVAEKCSGYGEEAVQDVKDNMSHIAEGANLDDKAEAVQSGASDLYNDAIDTVEAWYKWIYEKIFKGLGMTEAEFNEVTDIAADAALKSTEKISTAASGASNYASEKAGEAAKAASEAASNLKSKTEGVVGTATEKASEVKTKVKETLMNGKDKAAEVYEAAKDMKCKNCEATKEMASKTAGEIGSKIREKTSEL